AVATRMAQAITHRGPDDAGAWADASWGVAFGLRRLSIVDLSPAGHQPLVSGGGRYVIAFNGEIYTPLSLRDELQAVGAAPAWRGHSDTETLMAGFEAWGIEATLQKTVGMFAIALWDRQDRVLTLARDRFGEKPLYYGWAGQGEAAAFVFGSELKALRAYPGFANPVCREALAQYMRFMYVPAPRSIYEGIYKLEPGCLLTVRGTPPAASPAQPLRSGSTWGNVAVQRWWSLASVVEAGARNPITDEAEAIGALEKQLQEAVRLQSLADVPLGAFLSGGVDSSAIVALMQQQSTQAVKTFTVGFEESEFDESPHARAVAQHLGTDHTALFVTAAEAQAVIPRLPAMYDEPFADSSQIPTHLVCKAARQQVTVALSGDAGDELLGGYNRYFWGPRIWNRLAWLPYPAQQALGKVLTQVPATGGGALGRTLGVVRPGEKLHKLGRAIRGVRNLDDLYMNLVSEWQDPAAVVKGVGGPVQEPASGLADPLPAAGADAGPLRMMFRDSMTYLPDDILCKVDRAAMAVSLETRVPFLDHRVAELAWRLPLHMKIRGNQGKWALRQVLYRHVPRELIERPKAGFSIPIGQWLRGPLRDWAESLLDAQRLQAEGFFHPAPIRARWAEHLAGQREHTTSLWAVLMFQAWLQEQAQTQAQTPQGTAC
ncbi:asparagine synthase (glutamine-hydrolyzing), partial [Hydrogenophaga sp.]|uniref:asparagine synthase (glutamine-hydrolyzing) n=1 Tax=Hydrogenophaga sp. TaxID=1904254 RepID=UPI002733909E